MPDHEIWVVGAVDGQVAVLLEDLDRDEDELSRQEDDATRMVVEVAAALLGPHAVEGAVLRVPIGEVGEPVWEAAERDRTLEDELRGLPPDGGADPRRRKDDGG